MKTCFIKTKRSVKNFLNQTGFEFPELRASVPLVSRLQASKNSNQFIIKNKKGYTVLEAIPFIIIMFVLLGATLGSWGLAHTAIMHSIAARHGSFVYFNNRSDISYLRDFGDPDSYPTDSYYGRIGWRFSYIQEERSQGVNSMVATERFVDFTSPNDTRASGVSGPFGSRGYEDDGQFTTDHNNIWGPMNPRNKKKVAPAWIMVGYGICLNASCGN